MDKKHTKVKHDDRKSSVMLLGEQLVDLVESYSWDLEGRLPEHMRDELLIKTIQSDGAYINEERLKAKKLEIAQLISDKRKERDGGFTHRARAATAAEQVKMTDYDKSWGNRGEKEFMNTIKSMMVKSYYQGIPANIFLDEIKAVLPSYWILVEEENKRSKKKLSKTAITKRTKKGDKLNMVEHFELIFAIAQKKKPNTLLPELDVSNLSEDEVLKAFVLAEKSVYGVVEATATQETHKKMKALFESCGVATSNCDRYAWRDDAPVPLDLYDVEDDGEDEEELLP